ncbi:MAG: hypothetical protein ACM3SY_00755 [Candidatus Omnitrophota bacterium]
MLVCKSRLIELLNDEDERVVNIAAEALERFFYDSEGIIAIFLAILEKENQREHPRELAFAHRIRSFSATEEEVQFIPSLLVNLQDKEEDDESEELAWNLEIKLLETPFLLLEKHRRLFASNRKLMNIYEKARMWDKFRLMPPDDLWQLFERQFEHSFKEGEADRHEFVHMLVNLLVQQGDAIKPHVLSHLKNRYIDDENMDLFLVEMAGRLKLIEATPFLFAILRDSDPLDIIHQDCIRYIGMLGTVELVKTIERLYIMDEELRAELAEILGQIPHSYSEDLCIKLLEKENDTFLKTYFAGSLCNLFSLKGSEWIVDTIRKRRYDPFVLNLFDRLIPVYAYHKVSPQGLEELERSDLQFRKGILESSEFDFEVEDDDDEDDDETGFGDGEDDDEEGNDESDDSPKNCSFL